ncbi:hypothetical protein N0V82_007320 [Gnomoniopsis sp. IMI 355080]|nr:hypothetical protein N0V82_007320 [Gnomoniopsis sp. IMI 355080]
MPRYTITEPHPSVAQNAYIHAGRGGAGNFVRAPQTTSPAGVPTPLQPSMSRASTTSVASSGRFYSGRGGAGNAHSHIERPVLSFEDEFSRADKRETTSAGAKGYHVGRGGAGNFASSSSTGLGGGRKSRTGSSSSAASSASDSSSVSEGWKNRLSAVFKH